MRKRTPRLSLARLILVTGFAALLLLSLAASAAHFHDNLAGRSCGVCHLGKTLTLPAIQSVAFGVFLLVAWASASNQNDVACDPSIGTPPGRAPPCEISN
ncbi:MAG: hypothetical protein AB1898_29240 [Acidobacteriota bacterium]